MLVNKGRKTLLLHIISLVFYYTGIKHKIAFLTRNLIQSDIIKFDLKISLCKYKNIIIINLANLRFEAIVYTREYFMTNNE